MVRNFLVALALVGAASAQTPEDGPRSKIAAIHYPPLANYARIQGAVHLTLYAGAATLLSGHPMLAQTAIESAKALGRTQGETKLDMTYHFVIADTTTSVPVLITVPRGNAFERGVLRVLGCRTQKLVPATRCEEIAPPPNKIKIDGPLIEIWIYAGTHCIQNDQTALYAKR